MKKRAESLPLRIATYNIHKCRGLDGRTRPERIASVLKRLRPDVIALQEVIGPGPRGRGQEEQLSHLLEMTPVLTSVRTLRGHSYGNALLSRHPIEGHRAYDLSVHGYEPRGCQRVDIRFHGHWIHIYNVHLGTRGKERIRQVLRLIEFVADPSLPGPKILLGDFNEWRKGPATKILQERFQSLNLIPFLKWRRTYPSVLPVFHIDHIYYLGNLEIVKVEVPRNWSSMVASDHMPIVAELAIPIKK